MREDIIRIEILEKITGFAKVDFEDGSHSYIWLTEKIKETCRDLGLLLESKGDKLFFSKGSQTC